MPPDTGASPPDAGNRPKAERRSSGRRGGNPLPFLLALRSLSRIIAAGGDAERFLARACESLATERGYYEVWVAAIDPYDRVLSTGRFGIVPPTAEAQRVLASRELPVELRRVFDLKGAEVEFPDVQSDAGPRPGRRMTLRLQHRFEPCGVLSALMPRDLSRREEEEMFLEEAADRLALALCNLRIEQGRAEIEQALETSTQDLDAHSKKLKYVLAVSKLIGQQDLAPERVLQAVTDLIPLAWREPETVYARIQAGAREYRTDNYRTTREPLVAEIALKGRQVGSIEVGRRPDPVAGRPRPFTQDEQNLIQSLASLLAGVVARIEGPAGPETAGVETHTEQRSTGVP
jgi:hypothetical protein